MVVNETHMLCYTAPLVAKQTARRQATAGNITYTVVVDNAPGPDPTDPMFILSVKPNPVIESLLDTDV